MLRRKKLDFFNVNFHTKQLKRAEKNESRWSKNDGNTPALNVHWCEKLSNTMLRYAITLMKI